MTSKPVTKDASTQTFKILGNVPSNDCDELVFLMTTPKEVSRLGNLASQVDQLKERIALLQDNYDQQIIDLSMQIEILTDRIKFLIKENSRNCTDLVHHIQKIVKPSSNPDEVRLRSYLEFLDMGYLPDKKSTPLVRNLDELIKIEKITKQHIGIISQLDHELVVCDAFQTFPDPIIEARVLQLALTKNPTKLFELFKKI